MHFASMQGTVMHHSANFTSHHSANFASMQGTVMHHSANVLNRSDTTQLCLMDT